MKQTYLAIIIALVGGVALAFVYFYSQPQVSSFEDCVAAGNPVMESYPRQCRHKDQLFVEQIDQNLEPTSADGAPYGSIHNLPVPEQVQIVKDYVAKQEGVPTNQVVVLSVEEKTWPNMCSEPPAVDEMCVQVITPGYEVYVQVKGKQQRFRVSENGIIF